MHNSTGTEVQVLQILPGAILGIPRAMHGN